MLKNRVIKEEISRLYTEEQQRLVAWADELYTQGLLPMEALRAVYREASVLLKINESAIYQQYRRK